MQAVASGALREPVLESDGRERKGPVVRRRRRICISPSGPACLVGASADAAAAFQLFNAAGGLA